MKYCWQKLFYLLCVKIANTKMGAYLLLQNTEQHFKSSKDLERKTILKTQFCIKNLQQGVTEPPLLGPQSDNTFLEERFVPSRRILFSHDIPDKKIKITITVVRVGKCGFLLDQTSMKFDSFVVYCSQVIDIYWEIFSHLQNIDLGNGS